MRRRLVLAGATAGLAASTRSFAQAGYPNRPVTLVIPFPPGGQTDVIGRLVAERLSQLLGQPVIVENKPGVNGSQASDAVAHAKADGYTLVLGGPGTHAINQLVNPNVKYDSRRDFTHIGLLTRVPVVMLASPALKANTVSDVIAMSKASPGSLSVALTGIGSSGHMTTELFKMAAGISLNAVPYKGDIPAITDLIGGQVDLLFVPATSALSFAQSGKLRVLAVAGNKRLAGLPDVPTMGEAGQARVIAYSWTELAGPAGLPADVVKKLNLATQALLADPAVLSKLSTISNEPTPGTAEQAAHFVTSEIARWAEVVKTNNIRVD